MKKTRIVLTAIVVAIVIAHSAGSCKKKTEEYECKTCKAFGIDGPVNEEEVCSEAEEAAFRSANPGRQITCQ